MNSLGLYIHVPFCVKKCHYCSFASARPRDSAVVTAYFDALLREIQSYKNTPHPPVSTVYFGGGTPSYVDSVFIKKTMEALVEVFRFSPKDPQLEITIEVNPASAMAEKLAAYKEMGFNRLSVGLQSGNDRLLKTIGRPHDRRTFESTMEAAQKAGFTNISADVIFGLPGQTMADLDQTLSLLLSYPSLTHLSAYSLILEPGTPLWQQEQEGALTLPTEEEERAMCHHLSDRLAQGGLAQYEISNFARPGYHSRHNSAYWDLSPYIGLGLGAASYFEGRRYTNTADLTDYGQLAGSPEARVEDALLSQGDARGDFMFLGLRKTEGVEDRAYHQLFGSSFFEDYAQEIDELIKRQLIVKRKDTIALTPSGLDLANQVFMAFV